MHLPWMHNYDNDNKDYQSHFYNNKDQPCWYNCTFNISGRRTVASLRSLSAGPANRGPLPWQRPPAVGPPAIALSLRRATQPYRWLQDTGRPRRLKRGAGSDLRGALLFLRRWDGHPTCVRRDPKASFALPPLCDWPGFELRVVQCGSALREHLGRFSSPSPWRRPLVGWPRCSV